MPNPPFKKVIGRDDDDDGGAGVAYGNANTGSDTKAEDSVFSRVSRDVQGLDDTLEFNRPAFGGSQAKVGSHKGINEYGSGATNDNKKYLYPEIVDNSPIRYMITDDDDESDLRRMRGEEAKYIEDVKPQVANKPAVAKADFGTYESVAYKPKEEPLYLGSDKVASAPEYQSRPRNPNRVQMSDLEESEFESDDFDDSSMSSFTNDEASSGGSKPMPSFQQAAIKSARSSHQEEDFEDDDHGPINFSNIIGLEEGQTLQDHEIEELRNQSKTPTPNQGHAPVDMNFDDEGIVYNKAEALTGKSSDGLSFNTSNVGRGTVLDDSIAARPDEKDKHISQINFKGVFSSVKDLKQSNVVRSSDENVMEVWTDNSHNNKPITKTSPSPLPKMAQFLNNQVDNQEGETIRDVDGNVVRQNLQNFSWEDYYKNGGDKHRETDNQKRINQMKSAVYGIEASLDPEIELEKKVGKVHLSNDGKHYETDSFKNTSAQSKASTFNIDEYNKKLEQKDGISRTPKQENAMPELVNRSGQKIDIDSVKAKLSDDFFNNKPKVVDNSIEFSQAMRVNSRQTNTPSQDTFSPAYSSINNGKGKDSIVIPYNEVPVDKLDLNEITKLIFKIKE